MGPRRRSTVLLLGPTFAVLIIVIGYPIVAAVVQSLSGDSGLDPTTGRFTDGGFVGLNHYIDWLTQRCGSVSCPTGSLGSAFWVSVVNTFGFTIVTVALETVLGFWMALIMNRTFRGRSIVRAAVLVPWAIPTAITAKLWMFIFAFGGVANSMLNSSILWTADPFWSRVAIIVADVWKTTPFLALLILAGLQVIPTEIYEAARVDGARTVQQFVRITLPLIRPALMVAILFRTLDALRMYDLPAIMTGGGPGTATTTLSMLVVGQIRVGPNSAAALSTITFLVVFGVAYLFVRFLGANITTRGATTERGTRTESTS
ncbi:MAG TPA: sugar ABC transporter permease [Microbacteriaceae bacterium]|nr:sugar ABC transporter permease [Microbacteriaceae bacterium]